MAQEYRPKMRQPNTDMTSVGLPDVVNAARIGTQAANEIAQGEQAARTNRLNENAMLATLPTQMVAAEEALRSQVIDNKRSLALMPIEIEQAEAELDALNMANRKANLAFEMGVVKAEYEDKLRKIEDTRSESNMARVERGVSVYKINGGNNQLAKIASNPNDATILFSNETDELIETLNKSTDQNNLNAAKQILDLRRKAEENVGARLQKQLDLIPTPTDNSPEETQRYQQAQQAVYASFDDGNPLNSQLAKAGIERLAREQQVVKGQRAAADLATVQAATSDPVLQQQMLSQIQATRRMESETQVAATEINFNEARQNKYLNESQVFMEELFDSPEVEAMLASDNVDFYEGENNLSQQVKQNFEEHLESLNLDKQAERVYRNQFKIKLNAIGKSHLSDKRAKLEQEAIRLQDQAKAEGQQEGSFFSEKGIGEIDLVNDFDLLSSFSGFGPDLTQEEVTEISRRQEAGFGKLFRAQSPIRSIIESSIDVRLDELQEIDQSNMTRDEVDVINRNKRILRSIRRELGAMHLFNIVQEEDKEIVGNFLRDYDKASRSGYGLFFDVPASKQALRSINDILQSLHSYQNGRISEIQAEMGAINRMNKQLDNSTNAALENIKVTYGEGTVGSTAIQAVEAGTLAE